MSHIYVANGRTIALDPHHDHVAVRFREGVPHERRVEAVAGAGLAPWEHRLEIPHEVFAVHPVSQVPVPREERHAEALEKIRAHPDVHGVHPVFRHGEMSVVAPDRAVVGLRSDAGDVSGALSERGAKILERHEDELLVGLDPALDPLETCARLAEIEGVEFAEPDFVTLGHHSPKRSTGGGGGAPDKHQYALALTRAREAWEECAADPGIRIAIIDEGIQAEHPDLKSAVVAVHDACGTPGSREPEPWDAHGTACAGLAAGRGDGVTGVRGIAAGCSIVAVRMGYTPTEGGKFACKSWWMKRAIDWAWRNGSDVLSNSWGGVPESTAITAALERARTRGRGGKGCVIVVAAGNGDVWHGRIDFPGTLPHVLTVAASNEWDEPKTTKSADRERWWGSSYGPEVDVAAPGVDNFTSDNPGPVGFTNADYVPDFNGTSSATPIAAAVAALVLSANPELSESDVRRIVRDTAAKAGSVPYVDGRNDHMGCGRVDALAAVRAARRAGAPEDG